MMKKNIIIVLLLLISSTIFAQFPERPNPPKAVNDLVGILSQNEVQQLESKLRSFTNETSTAIVVVVVDDLHGMDRADYTISLAHEWGVGQKGKDNGIMIMVKPTGGQGQRRAFIAVGYGLEGVVPDAVANQIMDNEMIPNFKSGNYYAGIDAAVNVLMDITRGEYTAEQYSGLVHEQSEKGLWKSVAVLIFMFLLIFFKTGVNAYQYGRANNMAFFAAFWLVMNSGSHSGSYGHFTGGTGGFGGGSGFGGGGGFGGFGGGGFGGGGAGGSW
jgi:uncharacterized protein